jgi:hypothetical protein
VVRTGGIGVVDPVRLELVRRLNADRDYTTVSVSSDGRLLYAVDSTGAYVVLNPVSGENVLRRPDAGVASLLQVNRGE